MCLGHMINLCSHCPDSEYVVVSDSDPDPNYWIQRLDLFEFDLRTLQKGMDVTGNIIKAAQMVLRLQFQVQGLQSTTLPSLCWATPCLMVCSPFKHFKQVLFIILGSILLNIPFLQELTIGFVVHVVLEVHCNYLTVEPQTLEIELQLANIYSHNNPNPLFV